MSKEILDEIRKLRQEVEVQSAINVIEGIHTMETLAALGHFTRKGRPATPREAGEIEYLARKRWAEQVRHVMGVLRNETQLDEKMTDLAALLAEEVRPARAKSRSEAKKARKRARPAGKRGK